MMSYVLRNSGLSSIKFLCATLSHMSICTWIIISITFQKVNCPPDTEASTKSNNESLENSNRFIKEIHSNTCDRSMLGNCWQKGSAQQRQKAKAADAFCVSAAPGFGLSFLIILCDFCILSLQAVRMSGCDSLHEN